MRKIKKRNINEHTFAMAGGAGDPTLASSSYMVQGTFPGYTYQVLGFNDHLQQKPNKPSNEYYIHPGCRVSGVGVNNPDKTYTGIIKKIIKNEKGEVVCIEIQNEKTATSVTIQADNNLKLLIPNEKDQKGVHVSAPSYNMNIGRSMI